MAHSFDISGTLESVPSDRKAFLVTELIGPSGNDIWEAQKCFANRVWPVPVPTLDSRGNWVTNISLGENKSRFKGTVYKVTLVMVDAKVDYQFREYIRKAQEEGKYSGVETNSFAGAIEEVANVRLERL